MKKRIAAVLIALLLLFPCMPAVHAQEDGMADFEFLSVFSEDLAWVAYENQADRMLGVIDRDMELIYEADTGMAEKVICGEEGELVFETYPFRDDIAYYQAEGYGYVIIDNDGSELTSAIWTANCQPYIMARGEDLFLIREYDAAEECWYTYAISALGKRKGNRIRSDEMPEYRYIGEGLFLGTTDSGADAGAIVYIEKEKEIYEIEEFNAGAFFGFSEDGAGFVFLDSGENGACRIDPDLLTDEEARADWAEDPDVFSADKSTVLYYSESAGKESFYSDFDEAYIDYDGNTIVRVPDFGKLKPVGFGRFSDGTAPILLESAKHTLYITFINEDGTCIYEPVKIGKTDKGKLPELTEYATADSRKDDPNKGLTACIVYGDGLCATEIDEEILVADTKGNVVSFGEGKLCGIDGEFLYLEGALIPLDDGDPYEEIYRTKDTAEADQDWLDYAEFEGVYYGDGDTVFLLFADGTCFYREPFNENYPDLKQGISTIFDIEDGRLTIDLPRYQIYADIDQFNGTMTMRSDSEIWNDEQFEKSKFSKDIVIADFMAEAWTVTSGQAADTEWSQTAPEPDETAPEPDNQNLIPPNYTEDEYGRRAIYNHTGLYTASDGQTANLSLYSEIVSGSNEVGTIFYSGNSDYSDWMTEEQFLAYSGSYASYDSAIQYHYRTKTVKTVSEPLTESGWILESSNTQESLWGSWSAWSDQPFYASDTREVETQQVQISQGSTQYRYGRYKSTNCSKGTWYHFSDVTAKREYGGTWTPNYTSWSSTRHSVTDANYGYAVNNNSLGTGVYNSSKNRYYWNRYSIGGVNYWWEEVQTTPAEFKTQYRYRDKLPGAASYTYYKWSDWSPWTGTYAASDSNTEVETRTVYRLLLQGETQWYTLSNDYPFALYDYQYVYYRNGKRELIGIRLTDYNGSGNVQMDIMNDAGGIIKTYYLTQIFTP